MSDYTNTYFILFMGFTYSCFHDENILCTNKKKVLDEKEGKYLLLGSYPFEIQVGYKKCMQI